MQHDQSMFLLILMQKEKAPSAQKCRKRLEIKGFRGQVLTSEALFLFIQLWYFTAQTLSRTATSEPCGVRILE